MQLQAKTFTVLNPAQLSIAFYTTVVLNARVRLGRRLLMHLNIS